MLFITLLSAVQQALPPPRRSAGSAASGLPVCVARLRNKGCPTPPEVPTNRGGTGHVQAEHLKLVRVQPTHPASPVMSPRLLVDAQCCWSWDCQNNSVRAGNPPSCLAGACGPLWYPAGLLFPHVKVHRPAKVLLLAPSGLSRAEQDLGSALRAEGQNVALTSGKAQAAWQLLQN